MALIKYGTNFWQGNIGESTTQISKADLYFISQAASLTLLQAFGTAMLAYTDCNLGYNSLVWSEDINPVAPAGAANIDLKAVVKYRDPVLAKTLTYTFPAPKGAIIQAGPINTIIAEAALTAIVALLDTAAGGIGYVPLYGYVIQKV